jgi:hypothetical protein
MAKQTIKILLPDPSRLIEGLRDTGYDFNTAVADVIDNSVDAQAKTIDVRLLSDFNGEVVVDIIDDGCGMTEAELVDAMQYGAHGKKAPSRLGKFGLGLKTASTAFCKQLIVVSRKSRKQKPAKAVWDLDHVSKVNKWELILEDPTTEELELLNEVTGGGNGTLVRWAKVDRIHDKEYAKKDGKFALRALERRAEGLRSHVAMVYQRFLDPKDKRARTINLSVNGANVEAWDPFCREAKGTQKVLEKTIPVETDSGAKAEFTVRAFVVPRNEEFSSPADAKKARIGNEYQGFFVYRENRLIHGPGWLGMSQKEPHASLCRIEFSFDHHLDSDFKVDIKKSEVHLNDELFTWLKDKFVPGPKREAVERYRKGEKRKIQAKAGDAHKSSNAAIHAKRDDVTLSTTEITDSAKGIVEVTNKLGTFKLKLPVMTARTPGEVHVKAVDSIDDGLLWSPCLIDGNHAVQINQNHPYYAKVYVPNLAEGVTIQGMDSLLWGLVEAELDATTDSTKKLFHELRYEVSKLLRTLVEDLPDPDLEEGEQA